MTKAETPLTSLEDSKADVPGIIIYYTLTLS